MTIPAFMNAVKWEPTNEQPVAELPYATHYGELEIMGRRLRCYRLNTGEAIIHADDVRELFAILDPGTP